MRTPIAALVALAFVIGAPKSARAQAVEYFLIQLEANVQLDVDGLPTSPELATAAEQWNVVTYEPLYPPEAGSADPTAFAALGMDRTYRAVFAGTGNDVSGAVAAHTGLPGVVYVEEDGDQQEHGTPTDPLYSRQWGLHNDGTFATGAVVGADVNAEAAWDLVPFSILMIVAVLDGGVNDSDPDIAQRMWSNSGEIPGNNIDDDNNGKIDDVAGWDFAEDDAVVQDGSGHGSNVASVIAAQPNNGIAYAGACWHCSIMDVRDLNGTSGKWSWAAGAVTYAVDNRAQVINMSTGGTGQEPQTLHNAVRYAYANHVPIVVSMGNFNSAALVWPAAFPETIAVGATDWADLRCDPFTWGGGSSYGDHIDVVAPGQSIYGLYRYTGDYSVSYSGTSQAAPHVAGLAGLLLSVQGDLTVEEVRHYIRAGAVDEVGDSEDTPGWDRYYGAGRIDMEASLLRLMADIADVDGDGFSIRDGDCDDTNDAINPDELEIADDGIDQDCSGADAVICYGDADGDGSGNDTAMMEAGGDCAAAGLVAVSGDCDDNQSAVYPGAAELCDGLDNDCNGVIDDDPECEDGGGCCRSTTPGDTMLPMLLVMLAMIWRRKRDACAERNA